MRRGAAENRRRGQAVIGAGALIVAAFTAAQVSHDMHVHALRTPGLPPMYSVALSAGRTLSVYLDPGRAGPNGVHGTFIDAQGRELELARAPMVTATGPRNRWVTLAVLREGPGHFYSNGDFESGDWNLDVVATTRTGEVLRVDVAVQL